VFQLLESAPDRAVGHYRYSRLPGVLKAHATDPVGQSRVLAQKQFSLRTALHKRKRRQQEKAGWIVHPTPPKHEPGHIHLQHVRSRSKTASTWSTVECCHERLEIHSPVVRSETLRPSQGRAIMCAQHKETTRLLHPRIVQLWTSARAMSHQPSCKLGCRPCETISRNTLTAAMISPDSLTEEPGARRPRRNP
jgi:hypothetical protein